MTTRAIGKVLLAAAVGIIAALPAMTPAEAKSGAKATKAKTHAQRTMKPRLFDPNDPKCVEAEALDPGGTYAAYPCWARAALSPKGDGRWH